MVNKLYLSCKLEVTSSSTTHFRYFNFVCLFRYRTGKYYLKVMGRPYYSLSFEASLLKTTKDYQNKILQAFIGGRMGGNTNLFKKKPCFSNCYYHQSDLFSFNTKPFQYLKWRILKIHFFLWPSCLYLTAITSEMKCISMGQNKEY